MFKYRQQTVKYLSYNCSILIFPIFNKVLSLNKVRYMRIEREIEMRVIFETDPSLLFSI